MIKNLEETNHMTKKIITKTIVKLLDAKEDIKREKAQEAGKLGYMGRVMVMTSLPHKDTGKAGFTRSSGVHTFSIFTPPTSPGIPYGVYPRLLLAWITRHAVRRRDRTIVLPVGVTAFMRELGIENANGRQIAIMRDQSRRLFSSSISLCHYTPERDIMRNMTILNDADLWWTPAEYGKISVIELSKRFFEELINHPVPIDLRAYSALKHSPLAMDIYTWLTYRMVAIKQMTKISWSRLQAQFGADYANDAQGRRDFRKNFGKRLDEVLIVYDQAKAHKSKGHLILYPSPTHVSRKENS